MSRENIRKKMKPIVKMMLFVFVNVICVSQVAFASEIINTGFTTLTDLIKAFVSSIGSIIVLWGIFEWGNSLQSSDGMQQSMAFKRIGGGLVMTLAPQLLGLFI